MPQLSTPRIFACCSGLPLSGITVPTAANTAFMPAWTLGAPQTTSTRAEPGVDLAQAEPLGVRMAAHGDDLGDPERRQVGAAALDVLDLEAEHGQARDDLVQARLGRQMLLEPGQGELHRDRPP